MGRFGIGAGYDDLICIASPRGSGESRERNPVVIGIVMLLKGMACHPYAVSEPDRSTARRASLAR
jgi:hypothetical protein